MIDSSAGRVLKRRRALATAAVMTIGVLGLSPAHGDLLSGLTGSGGDSGGALGSGGLLGGLDLLGGGAKAESNGSSKVEPGTAAATGTSTPATGASKAPDGSTGSGVSKASGSKPASGGAGATASPSGISAADSASAAKGGPPAPAIPKLPEGASTGFANANTGDNTSAGNTGNNTASGGSVSGLIALNLGLGAPTATTTGDSQISTGAAGATGNGTGPGAAAAALGQHHACGVGPAIAAVNSVGSAAANTGGNRSAGNGGNNTAIGPTVTGGLIGLNLSLGAPTAVAEGTSRITTSPAGAEGNNFASPVCDRSLSASQPPVAFAPPVAINGPRAAARPARARSTLARTGPGTGMGIVSAITMGVGAALLTATRRRRTVSPMGSGDFSAALAGSDWDAVVTR